METLKLPVWLTVCALVIMLVRQYRPEFATLASVAAGIVAFFLLKGEVETLVGWIGQMQAAMRIPDATVRTMLKAGGIALISEFAADLCADAGEKALAGRIDMAERIVLTVMCLPLAGRLLQQAAEVLP